MKGRIRERSSIASDNSRTVPGPFRAAIRVPMFADEHHHVGVKHRAEPNVKGVIGVCGNKVGVVIGRLRVDVVTACGLDPNRKVAEAVHSQAKRILSNTAVFARRPPTFRHLRLNRCGQGIESVVVDCEGQRIASGSDQAVRRIGRSVEEHAHEIGACRWSGPYIASCRLQSIHDCGGGGGVSRPTPFPRRPSFVG